MRESSCARETGEVPGHEPRVKGSVCTHAHIYIISACGRPRAAQRELCAHLYTVEESTSDTTGLQERWAAGVPE